MYGSTIPEIIPGSNFVIFLFPGSMELDYDIDILES